MTTTTTERTMTDQPPPKPNDSRPIWELVIEDMQARDRVGRERYGTPLQAHNGRDSLVDAYQEALDLCAYLRQTIAERTRLKEERDALLELLEANVAAFDDIDAQTEWRKSEPKWWLAWSEQARASRKAIALVKGGGK